MARQATTGVPEVDRLAGGIIIGDNIVWEANSGAPINKFISAFISAREREKAPVVYVSFNRSPQAIAGEYAGLMSGERFILVDCFSSGKGNEDRVFLDFLEGAQGRGMRAPVHLDDPADPAQMQNALADLGAGNGAGYVFDSLTGMLQLWGDEEKALKFFSYYCPRLFDLNTIACWLLEKEAHSAQFLAKLRHVTQVVLDVAVVRGVQTLTVIKAANRTCLEIGVPQQFVIAPSGSLRVIAESREGRELALLSRIGEVLGSALNPNSFFEGIMQILASELGMMRGTLVLLDRMSGKIKIAAAHGLSTEERQRGEYSIGEGITGSVVKSGVPEIVPDIGKDPRFLDRTVTRRRDPASPIAFICVPLRVDDEVVGALSVDRPFAVESALSKDLRLLSIVGSFVAQVIRINRMVHVEKEEILARNETHLRDLRTRYRLHNVVGESEAMRAVLATAAMAARSRATVLITGETGTGKELAANIVHYNSPRGTGPFVKVNCGALPDTLLESELFGHVKGAFTGAVRDRKGRFEIAHGGTLFLDEIGEMSPHLQVKLLRVLQERQFEPVGSAQTIEVDVRVVAATSRDLAEEIRHGRFRQDLYYRLNVIPIQLPPLRERRGDISLLVNHFLGKYNKENHTKVTKLSRDVLDLLVEYPWPGNVRELENCIERAVVMSPGDSLLQSLLPTEILDHKNKDKKPAGSQVSSEISQVRRATERCCEASGDLAAARETLMRTVEETIISSALARGMSQRDLSKQLGLSRMTLRKRMKEYGM